VDQTPINCTFTLAQPGPVRVEMVRYTEHEPLYNSLVDQFHYLGCFQIAGNHLKYMAFAGEVPLACIGWGCSGILSSTRPWTSFLKPCALGIREIYGKYLSDEAQKQKQLRFQIQQTLFLCQFGNSRCAFVGSLALLPLTHIQTEFNVEIRDHHPR
jgi:hypothetical protein